MKKNNFLKRIAAALVAFVMVLGTITPGLVTKAADLSSLVDFTVEVPAGRDIKVLQLTDTQIIDAAQAREGRTGVDHAYWATDRLGKNLFQYITQVVDSYQPDLILVTGDLTYGEFDDNGTSLLRLIDFMESLNVKWAPVFGNHEAETKRGIDWVCDQLEAAPNCLFKQGDMTGNSNYSVGLVQGDKLVRVFYMLDSNGSSTASAESMANGQTKKEAGFGQDQIDWYTESIHAVKAESPDTKFSMAFHIQMKAWADALAQYGYDETTIGSNPIDLDSNSTAQADGAFGYVGRALKNPWDADKTVFNGAKALGVDSMFVGHEHCNSASVVYEGVRLTYGLKTGVYDRTNYKTEAGEITSSYADAGDPIVGGTAINVGSDGVITDIHHIYYQKIIETTTTVTPDAGKTDIKNPALVSNAFAQTNDTPSGYTGSGLFKAEGVANNASMGVSFGDVNVEGKKVYLKYYVPSYNLTPDKAPAWQFYANDEAAQPSEPEPNPEPTGETIPTGLTKLTFTSFDYPDQAGKIGLTSNTTQTLDNTILSGYLTLHGSGQFIHYGATEKAGWDGIRIRFDGTKLHVSSNDATGLSVNGGTATSTVALTAEKAGVDSFADTKILLQITLQKVGSDLKMGIWFNGKLYDNSYITLTGDSATLGGYLNFVNTGTVDIESHTYVDPEPEPEVGTEATIPTGLTKLTFTSFDYPDQAGKIGLTSNTTQTLDDTILSGYLTLHGSGQYIHYGATKKAGWDGIRIRFDGTKLHVSSNDATGLSVNGGTATSTVALTAEKAGVASFADTKILLQITLQKVGSDLKMGIWFNGKLYDNSYITLTGNAATLGGYLNFVNTGTVDIESYIYTDPIGGNGETFYEATGIEFDKWAKLDVTSQLANFKKGDGTLKDFVLAYCANGSENATVYFDGFEIVETAVSPEWSAPLAPLYATFKADGVVVGEPIPFEPNAASLTNVPAVPEKQGYNGTWEAYTLGTTDIVVNAYYEDGTIQQIPTGLTKLTFSDWGWGNKEAAYWETSGATNAVEGAIFSGNVTFHGNSMFIHYGATARGGWDGIRLNYNGTNLLVSANDQAVLSMKGSASTTVITLTPDKAGLESFKDTKVLLQMTLEKSGSNLKLGMWFDGVLYDNSYITLAGMADSLGGYMNILQPQGDQNNGNVDIESYVYTDPDPEPEDPEELPTGLTNTTFSDWMIENGTYDFMNKTYGISVAETLFTGYVTFEKNGTAFMYGGKDPWQGFRLELSDGVLKYDNIAAEEAPIIILPAKAGVGDTFLSKRFLLQMTTQVVDSDNDGTMDDVKFGLWIDGKLYNNTYFTYTDASSFLGSRIFIPENGKIILESDPNHQKPPVELPPTQQPEEGLTEITFANFGIKDGDYTAFEPKDFWVSGRYRDMEKGYTLDNTLFKGKVKFSPTGVTRIYYGGFKNNAWGGVAIFADGQGNLVVADTKEGATYAKLIEPQNAGCKLAGEWIDLMMSTQYVDHDNDGARDDLKFGLWLNGRLYLDEYIFINDLGGLMGSFMGLYGPVEESAISVRSDATVDSKISLEMYGFGDDYEKQFKPEASNRIEGKPHGVLGGVFSGDTVLFGTIMTGLLLSVAGVYFALRRRRSL